MKKLLGILLLVCMVLPMVVVAEDFPTDCPKELMEQAKAPAPIEKPIKIEVVYNQFQKSIITTIMEMIGLEEKETVEEKIENSVDVFIGDFKVANIPTDSKFVDVEVHDTCLKFQYGTDNWFECEQRLL